MRLERLNYNKIKIFLTFDDLLDRGLTKEDLWNNNLKVHQLFRDMIDEATAELGFEVNGSIAVEVYSLKAQGMVIIVTNDHHNMSELDEEFSDDYIEMQVTLDECEDIFYEFHSLEDIIYLTDHLMRLGVESGMLYSYHDKFYLLFDEFENNDDFIAILSEYGNPATITTHRVHEYGKLLMEENAIQQIFNYFISKRN